MEDTITVTKDQYFELLAEHTLLRVLLINGVDKWERFNESVELSKQIIKDAVNNQTEDKQ